MKPYRVVARIKNNRLWRALAHAFPQAKSAADFSRATGVDQSRLGELINIKAWPARIVKDSVIWNPVAIRLSEMTGEDPWVLFDPSLYGQKAHVLTAEVSLADMATLPCDGGLLEAEARVELESRMRALNPRERAVVRQRMREIPLRQISAQLGISNERVWQIEGRAHEKIAEA